MREIYLDHAASAPLLPEARVAVLAALDAGPGNASSSHAAGRRQRRALAEAREAVAALVGARPEEVVFTSGCTESNVIAIRGALAGARTGRTGVVSSAAAHASVAKLLEGLAADGTPVATAGVDRFGTVRAGEVLSLVDERTAVLTLPLGESVTGALQPVAAVSAGLATAECALHVDASQGVARVPVDLFSLGGGLLTFSAHKFGGPQGIGALVIRDGTPFSHPDLSGSQERGRRPGTEAVALAAGFGAAAIVARDRLDEWTAHWADALAPLDDYIARTPGATCLSPEGARLPHVRLVAFDGCPGDAVLAALDARGIRVSTGSACTSGARTPPEVLIAGGHSRTHAARAVRVSAGSATPVDELWELVRVLDAVLPAIRAAGVEEKKSSFSRPEQ